jgi:hypothetical protein
MKLNNTFDFLPGPPDGDLFDPVDEDAVAVARKVDSRQHQPVERLSEAAAGVKTSQSSDRHFFARRGIGHTHPSPLATPPSRSFVRLH